MKYNLDEIIRDILVLIVVIVVLLSIAAIIECNVVGYMINGVYGVI